MRVILVGGGKTAYFLAKRFIEKNHAVTLIESDADEARRISRALRVRAIVADGSTPAGLEDAEVRRAEAVIALTAQDQFNLVACQLAKSMFGVPRTIALVNDPDNLALFHTLGVDATLSVSELLGHMIEERATADELRASIALAGGKVQVSEIVLPPTAPAVNRELREIELPRGALVACIIRGDGVLVPGGTTRLLDGDRLVVVAQPENHGRTIRQLVGDE